MNPQPKPRPRVLVKREQRMDRIEAYQVVRRQVLARDNWRCRIVGCGKHEGPVDVHHAKPRSLGGGNTTKNLITACRFHHGLIHARAIRVTCTTARGADGPIRVEEL